MSRTSKFRSCASRFNWYVLLLIAAVASSCGRGGAEQAPPPQGPSPVGVVVLASKPVTITSEYVGLLRSRRSSQVRPQVEGIITRIFVKSGDRVALGTPLLQLDPLRQQAAFESDQASRAQQEAAVRYAEQQYERAKQLVTAGATSQQEFEQAETNLNTAKAALEALKAREQESRVELQYYRVAAPTGGIVGDIPVRVGDRVETSTELTTVDEQAGLEVYVRVPIERAPEIRTGLPLRITNSRGEVLAETAIDFVSPQVDDRTQSVLVKGPVPSGPNFARSSSCGRSSSGATSPA